MLRTSLSTLSALLLTLPAAAQAVGSLAPDQTWGQAFLFGEIPSKKLSDLRGSVVLLEFWGTH